MFNVQPLIMTTFEPEHDFENEDFSGAYEQKRIVADAEKAFVSLLKPEYNVVKFTSYPKGADGLYGSDFVRYGYVICESFSFNTAHGRIRGSRDAATGFITNDADSIFVEGNSVKLFVSGVDFPGRPARNKPRRGLAMSAYDDDVPLADPAIRTDYEAALGRFILAFNEVDHRLSQVIGFELSARGRADLTVSGSRGPFAQRLETLDVLASNTKNGGLSALPISRLRSLNTDRDTLAHGHFDQEFLRRFLHAAVSGQDA